MVLVSHIHKFIYLKNYKVAGTSVESFFGKYCIDPKEKPTYNFPFMLDKQDNEYGMINVPIEDFVFHPGAVQIKNFLGDEVFNDYFKFCVVRNPYDLMVSAFFFCIPQMNIRDFKNFCKEFEHNYFTDNLQRILLDGKPICQYYIRYENLKEDIVVVLEKLGISDYNLEDLPNYRSDIRYDKRNYREYYDEETREIVANLFKVEIEMFQYEF